MRLRDGKPAQKLLLGALIGAQFLGMALAVIGAVRGLGQPHPGWYLEDTGEIAPMRLAAADQGLRGGGRLVAINGVVVDGPEPRPQVARALHLGRGERNALVVRQRRGTRSIEVPVQPLTLADVLYGQGATMALGALFFGVGLLSFVLRPWEIGSWALLSFCHFCSVVLWNAFADPFRPMPLAEGYLRAMGPLLMSAALHLGLAFPRLHPLLLRGRGIPVALYAGGVAHAVLVLHAWRSGPSGPWVYVELFSTGVLLLAILFFLLRCARLAVRRSDRLVAQRARILLAGAFFGGALPATARFVQVGFGEIDVDPRYGYWTLAILLWALAHTAIRPELLNARVAVRRALIYAAVVVALTAAAIAVSSLSPFAVAGLLMPLLYLWPRFDQRLDDRFYPKRAQMLELSRGISEEIADAERVADALRALARGAARLFDARSAVAVLFATAEGPEEIAVHGAVEPGSEPPLEKEPLVQLLSATRREVQRDQIPIEPHYARILDDSYACLDRLDAEVLIPIVLRERVVGALAMGPRTDGERYRSFDIGVISALAHGAIQNTVQRIRAAERLRARELEFADLKRFLPETIIEQVMERGGAAELRSQRRHVTVLFADLRGFTAFSEQVEPEELMATLAEYHEAMGRRISEFAGTLERFAGDGFMVFFNDPIEQPDHATRAARMALAMRDDVGRLRERWARRGWSIHLGVGIATGYATVGFIGYEGRRDYGVIGAVTNLASRLSERAEPGEILISAATAAELPASLQRQAAGEVELAGFSWPQPVHRLLGAA